METLRKHVSTNAVSLTLVKLLLLQLSASERVVLHVNRTDSPGMGLTASGRSRTSNESSTAPWGGQCKQKGGAHFAGKPATPPFSS